jgi:hypothetical protein
MFNITSVKQLDKIKNYLLIFISVFVVGMSILFDIKNILQAFLILYSFYMGIYFRDNWNLEKRNIELRNENKITKLMNDLYKISAILYRNYELRNFEK